MLTGTTGNPSKDSDPHDEQANETQAGRAGQIRVLLAGGSRLLQESVIQLLGGSRFAVHSCVESLDHAVRLVSSQPDSFDLFIVQLFGNSEVRFFDSLAQLKHLAGQRGVVLLAWPEKELAFVASSVEAGVDAYIESNISQESFRQSLDRVISGEHVYPSRLSPATGSGAAIVQSADQGYRAAANPAPGAHLSGREIEILRHLANGEPNKVIANELQITEATVKVHVKGILRKIGAANRTQAAIWAIHNGLSPIFSNGGDAR